MHTVNRAPLSPPLIQFTFFLLTKALFPVSRHFPTRGMTFQQTLAEKHDSITFSILFSVKIISKQLTAE